jgi:hypothetical protein
MEWIIALGVLSTIVNILGLRSGSNLPQYVYQSHHLVPILCILYYIFIVHVYTDLCMRSVHMEYTVHVHTLVHLGTVLLGLLSVMQHR